MSRPERRAAGRAAGTRSRTSSSRRLTTCSSLTKPRSPSKIEGASGFAAAFSSSGPRDAKGRSLRDLDMASRLLRYPCSYMIYSAQFEQLPAGARMALYQRLWTILSGKERDSRYGRLSDTDRRAIVEILRGTKPDLPAFFR